MDINNLILMFESEYNEKYNEEKDEELRLTFVETFPKENIKDMKLEDYALGKKDNNLCWWLEFNANNLGSIKGGSSEKFKIYFSKKNNKWVYIDKKYKDEKEAWDYLKMDISNFIEMFERGDYKGIKEYNLDKSLKALKMKLLYMYFPDRVIPIYSEYHLHRILINFGFDKKEIENYTTLEANLKLKEYKENSKEFNSWSGLKFMRYIYEYIYNKTKVYKISPGEDGVYWNECLDGGYICIGWDEVGDLRNYSDYEEFRENFSKKYNKEYNKSKIVEKANEVWKFYNLEAGNIIIANKGINTILGVGTVSENGYEFDNSRKNFKHIVHINWKKDFKQKSIEPQKYWAFKTITEVSEDLYNNIEDYITIDHKKVSAFTEDEEKIFKEFKSILDRQKNLILYGPPGTGKTYLSSRYISWLKNKDNKNIEKEICTFHPSFDYEDFIEGYKPHFKDGTTQFELVDGVFKALCKKAIANKKTDYYLIIDEINRGNIEKIFGEMITLIEKDKRGNEWSLVLSQSKEIFFIPENVYIIGTMNTTDKSIRMLDAAIRRRFSFKECMPNYNLISEEIEGVHLSPAQILKEINKSLRKIEGRDKQIGHAYFMNNSKQISSINDLKQVYIYDIIPLVSEYCYNDYENMGKIIGDAFIEQENQQIKDEIIYGTSDYFISELEKHFGEKYD